jgi:hypothetical protein
VLLEVAELRAECARLGITEVGVSPSQAFSGPKLIARLSPLPLRVSQTIRLKRLHKASVYKEDLEQVQLPVHEGRDLARTITAFLRDIAPEEEAA